jgi:hypothetical protein
MKKPMTEKSVDLYVNIQSPVAIISTIKIRDQCCIEKRLEIREKNVKT